MRLSLAASLFLSLGLIHPVWTSLSVPPEELEGSGYDLDGSGSGSGDGSEEGVTEDQHNSKDGRILAETRDETKITFHGFSDKTFGNTHRSAADDDSGYVAIANSRSYFENSEFLAGVIAGGVTGLALAATVAGILIYKWQKKEEEDRYSLGPEKALDHNYQKPNREKVFLV
ncbi:syndecan-1-like [Simochromis diagramma]|uniref:syndecan-1 n=1 Tax=Haplochromis burtoni TaxID=8153 RepID=UPI0003BD2551|nr:syndecan-1 [Haplochromis burtoni]XP_039874155.1 syndecan-1-like [Simochromis diagramma]